MTSGIRDLDVLEIDGVRYREAEPPVQLPKTDGWMHSGCAILGDGTVAVAHPEGRRLILSKEEGSSREVAVPALEMHTIGVDTRHGGETLWLVNNGHRFVKGEPDYDHYRERGSVIRVALDGEVRQEIHCPEIEAYAAEPWQPTSICRGYDGSIWVADGYGANLVHRFSPSGAYLRTFDADEAGAPLDCPHGIAALGEQLLIADRGNRRVLVLEGERIVGALDAPLTSPSSILVLGEWLLVTELFGGLAVFRGDEYVGHFARSTDDVDDDAWPNVRDERGHVTAPTLGPELRAPHGIAGDRSRIVLTEWLIGGRVREYRPE
ncbi:hypothetical protein [Gulosibacter sp. 10]|uniref:hypothetical protein n=1 Tax=Gulosibacter sp. 10 TaxID=1255570 RepID=UPI00097F6B56|nr:hypothetical protein [Gulosibacter sp. 10]SJM71796.1 peptidylglycine monooxygenase-like protien [Gulosibacter sp. 10]